LDRNKYAILILAAGNSTRLGRPKQLIKWNKSTLLNNTIEQASKIDNLDIYVALGGNKGDIHDSILSEATIVDISNWQDGMGTSISSGLNQIEVDNYDGIIISVCDQPYISYNEFFNLIYAFENSLSSIIISRYDKGSGPPSLFSRKHYHSLLQIRGDIGAKNIVRENLDDVSYIPFMKGSIDIDTEKDVKNLSKNNR